MWGWLPFQGRMRRRRSPFNNLGPEGLTCGQVTEHLFVGGELGPNDWHALRHEGVTMLINLQQEQQDVFTEEEQVDGYLWLPSPDGLAPTLGQLALGVDFIQSAVEGNRKIFVHCKAGQGRAPLLCACYLISRGATLIDALMLVRRARPQTMLTPEQNVRLREFASAFATANQPNKSKPLPQKHGQPRPQVKPAINGTEVISPRSSNGTSPESTNGSTSDPTPRDKPQTVTNPSAKHSPI